MIVCVLLIWIGVSMSAPWWYFALLSVSVIAKMVDLGIKMGKKASE